MTSVVGWLTLPVEHGGKLPDGWKIRVERDERRYPSETLVHWCTDDGWHSEALIDDTVNTNAKWPEELADSIVRTTFLLFRNQTEEGCLPLGWRS